jgi:membrane-associated protease RseP (regulator of RpoE activity)
LDAVPGVVWPRRKFQHRYATHTILFLLTLVTTTGAGWLHYAGYRQMFDETIQLSFWSTWHLGFYYSIPMLLILGAHEFGHYWYCRRHDVDASLPYFLPAPLPLTGTLGAVIRIREAFPSTRALFDIGVAGPIAGFIVLLPFLWWGITHSEILQLPDPEEAVLIYFGEPALLKYLANLHFGPLPAGSDIVLHPVGFAAWFGLLATALNLLPFGQLDGGHIAYAVFGRHARWVSIATLASTVMLWFTQSGSWFMTAVVMLLMAIFLGVGHPRIVDEGTPLDPTRKLVALLALMIFLLCFTPVPIEIVSFEGPPQ